MRFLPCGRIGHGQAWFRLWHTGPGLVVKTRRAWLFSDRMGYGCVRVLGLSFAWLSRY